MTQVDFYILAEGARGDRYQLACRLAEKALSRGHRVYIHTTSESESSKLDRLLWTYRDDGFLPHGLSGQVDASLNPVLIGHGSSAGDEHDVLINLAPEAPEFFSLFERVAEPIDHDDAVKHAGRERYRFYRDRGYTLSNHQVKR